MRSRLSRVSPASVSCPVPTYCGREFGEEATRIHAVPGVPSPGRHHDLAARRCGDCSARFRSVARVEPVPRRLPPVRRLAAGYELLGRVGLTHERPPWGITSVKVVGARSRSPRRPPTSRPSGPCCTSPRTSARTPHRCRRCCVVAPLSGHFATLLRGTVRTLLAEQDVWVYRLAQRPRRPRGRRQLRVRRLHRAPHPVARGARARHPRDRGVPTVRRRAGRHRGDGRGGQPGDAPHAHADGRARSTPGSTRRW